MGETENEVAAPAAPASPKGRGRDEEPRRHRAPNQGQPHPGKPPPLHPQPSRPRDPRLKLLKANPREPEEDVEDQRDRVGQEPSESRHRRRKPPERRRLSVELNEDANQRPPLLQPPTLN